jgi:phosphoribosyl-AMP cyclohydrolase
MFNDFFHSIEEHLQGEQLVLSHVLENLSFNSNGLIPIIAQDHHSRDVLMLAWMNQEAIEQTLHSGDMTYWSRSRSQLWRKGETSGHHQRLKTLRIDCDGDTLLCDVEQLGVACHTGRRTCFYLKVDTDSSSVMITDSAPKQRL